MMHGYLPVNNIATNKAQGKTVIFVHFILELYFVF